MWFIHQQLSCLAHAVYTLAVFMPKEHLGLTLPLCTGAKSGEECSGLLSPDGCLAVAACLPKGCAEQLTSCPTARASPHRVQKLAGKHLASVETCVELGTSLKKA